ncbi:MAG: hypothetical protein GF353_27150 [Candidatus Lokiarchaeota archaeon]|nr:hypothetical protein [Candidatus Lokiarchaeota archaeon]
MKTIGIIIDEYHLHKKAARLLYYLKSKANINIYLEEDYVIQSNDLNFEEDLFFVKAKGDLVQGLVRLIESETSIPVINSYKGLLLSIHRFLGSTILEKAGITVPLYSLNPINYPPPFKDYIIKNIIDKKNYAFSGEIEKTNKNIHVADKRALKEAVEPVEKYKYYYYQSFIKSKWEYKIYGVGDDLFFYKQLPLLVNPNKMETREKIKAIPILEERVRKIMKTLNLQITSIDFLKSNDDFFLTDVNCTPNFNYMKNGPKIVGDFLIKQAKK